MNAPEHCANCGAAIPPKARACPECGADERTGWADQSIYDGLDLPDDEETQERDSRSRQHHQARQWFWWLIGVILILTFIFGALGLR